MSSVNPRRDYQREHLRQWKIDNPEKAAERRKKNANYNRNLSPTQRKARTAASQKWRKANPEKLAEQCRLWRARNKDKYDISHLRTTYKITKEQAIFWIEQKKSGCKACGKATGRMHVDHNHQTGKIRGILCHGCNASLGFAADSPTVLRSLAWYVEQDGTI